MQKKKCWLDQINLVKTFKEVYKSIDRHLSQDGVVFCHWGKNHYLKDGTDRQSIVSNRSKRSPLLY